MTRPILEYPYKRNSVLGYVIYFKKNTFHLTNFLEENKLHYIKHEN